MQRNMQGVVLERAVEADADEMDIDGGKKEATYVISPPTADRHRSIFLPTGWEARLQHFRANPVFLWGHRSWGEERDVLGFWREVWVDKKKGLMGRAVYDLDKCERAREVWPMVEEGLIKAVSQGCYTYASVWSDEEDRIKELPPFAKKAFKDGEILVCYTDQELLEVSQVLIGSNRQALLETINRGLCTRSVAVGIAWEPPPARGSAPPADDIDEAVADQAMARFSAEFFRRGAAAAEAQEILRVALEASEQAAKATPSESREGGPTTMAVDPKHFFRTINEIRAESGAAPIPGGNAVVLPEGVRTVEEAVSLEVRAEATVPAESVEHAADASTLAEMVREAVKAEFDAFLAAGGGIEVPVGNEGREAPATEERTYTDEDYEEASDALVDYAVAQGRALDADERAAFLEAYLTANATRAN